MSSSAERLCCRISSSWRWFSRMACWSASICACVRETRRYRPTRYKQNTIYSRSIDRHFKRLKWLWLNSQLFGMVRFNLRTFPLLQDKWNAFSSVEVDADVDLTLQQDHSQVSTKQRCKSKKPTVAFVLCEQNVSPENAVMTTRVTLTRGLRNGLSSYVTF